MALPWTPVVGEFYRALGAVWVANGSSTPGGAPGGGIDIGGTVYPQLFSAISASSSGNNTIVAAVPAKKIRVIAYSLVANGVVNFKFQSGAGGTDLTGLKYMPSVGAGMVQGYNPLGWFETAAGALLNLNLSAAVAVGGEIVYIEV